MLILKFVASNMFLKFSTGTTKHKLYEAWTLYPTQWDTKQVDFVTGNSTTSMLGWLIQIKNLNFLREKPEIFEFTKLQIYDLINSAAHCLPCCDCREVSVL